MSDFWHTSDDIKNDQRMIDLLWVQHKEKVELSARHSQEFVRLALTIKKELHRDD